jgi:hypothetical protein
LNRLEATVDEIVQALHGADASKGRTI